jgi:PhnB protein
MAKGKLIDQFDQAVEAMMSKPSKPAAPDTALRSLDPRLGAILRIAGELRDLPRAEFKSNLKARLASSVPTQAELKPVGGKPLITEEDIYARIKEMADEPRLVAHDVNAALEGLPEMSMKFLAPVNNTTLIVSRGSSPSSWERHPGGEEMIYVVEGAAELVTLTDAGPVKSKLREGSLFVCPQGLWHRTIPQPSIAALYMTPGEGTENSRAKDPRGNAPGKRARATGKRGTLPRLDAHDLRAALREVPHLTITESTTGEEADAAVRTVAKLDQLTFGVMSYSGLTPWERHPDGDELLYALDGEVEVTVLTDDGPVRETIRKGSAFVCPRGLWHRQLARKSVSMLYGTATETSEVSFAEDPRSSSDPREAEKVETAAAPRRGIMPFMYVEGAGRAADFYKQVFGATELMREFDPDGTTVNHAMLTIGDTTIMISDPTSQDVRESGSQGTYRTPHMLGGSPLHLYIYVANVDEVFKRALEAGAKVIDPVEDKGWGDRCGGIEDPFGHVWWVGTPLKDLPPKQG